MLLVLVPHGFDIPPPLWEQVAVIPYASAADVRAALEASPGSVVLVSDGLDGPELNLVADAIRPAGRECIEVRSKRWDGQSPSPLSAVCRGVISGFGPSGVAAAVRVLSGGP